MSNNLVPCPYCGYMIDNSITRCPKCNEIFEERTLPIEVDSLGRFIVLNFFTLGLYQNIWLLLNLKTINNMASSKKDKLKLDVPAFMLILSLLFLASQLSSYVFYLFGTISKFMLLIAACLWVLSSPLFWISCILMYIISYRVLRIIEKYTYKHYDIRISHSEAGWLFCPLIFLPLFTPFFYLIYFIYTFKERVYNPKPVTM